MVQQSYGQGYQNNNDHRPPRPHQLQPHHPLQPPHRHYDSSSNNNNFNNNNNNNCRSRRHVCCISLACCSVLVAAVAVGIAAVVLADRNASERRANKNSYIASKSLDYLNQNAAYQSTYIQAGCESTILLVRHCEKFGPHTRDTVNNEHCSYVGFERSKYLATLFDGGSISSSSNSGTADAAAGGGGGGDLHSSTTTTRWPAPSKIYALSLARPDHYNFREWETVKPVSDKTGIPIEIVDHPDLARQYHDVLKTGTMCGKLAIVSWRHEYMSEIALALGCGPEAGCPETYPADGFDEVWQIKYVFDPPVLSRQQQAAAAAAAAAEDTGQQPLEQHGWQVFGTVTKQNFDPLAYSSVVGDYRNDDKGRRKGGRWIKE